MGAAVFLESPFLRIILIEISLERALMRGSLSCILPAVSTNTTSMPLSLAWLIASKAMPAASCLAITILYHLLPLISLRRVKRVEPPGVSPQLLYISSSEGVTSSYQHCELVLYQPEANLGQVGGLSNLIRTFYNYIIHLK